MAAKKASIKKDAFVKDDFVTEVDGVEIRLPSLAYLKPGIIRKLRNRSQLDALYTILEIALGEGSEALNAVDEMDAEDFASMVESWSEHSGTSLGE